MDKYSGVMYFDTDDDFYKFCVDPCLVEKTYDAPSGDISECTDFNFSQGYLEALEKNTAFVIRNMRSEILKHGSVSYRTITKNIQNVKPWYFEKIFKGQNLTECK